MTARLWRGYTAAQVRDAEGPLLAAGVPLMRRAAAGLASELRTELERIGGGRVVLLAGAGNNGGDGLFAVAELAEAGSEVVIVPTGSRLHDDGLRAATEAGAVLGESAGGAALLVDAIVGTGTTGDVGLRGRAHELVAELLGQALPPVVAVDIPSGIGVDDGTVPEDRILLPARVTVTFGAMKAGLLLAPASEFAGEVRLIDIGIGPYLPR